MSAVPQRIDRYVIERELGRGSFGAVYKARHSVIGRDVALKVLHAERATSPSVLERFLGEARAVAAIGSPHIVQMYDAGLTADGKAFLAMELLDGEDLSQLLERRGRLSAAEAIQIGREVCLALAAAHRAGVVHRDLKPANIFLARDPAGGAHAKVLDFGVSKITRPEGEELTMTGTMLGTPHYMAPEQLSNSRGVDGRADLYAVGTVLFEMLSLSLPYDAETLASLIAAKMSDAPRSLSQLVPDVPGPLATVVLRSLSWDPRARFATADEMEQALAQALPHASASTPPLTLDPAMARTELARSQPSHSSQPYPSQPYPSQPSHPSQPQLGASGGSTAVRPPSHPHPSHPPSGSNHPGAHASVAQSSIVALPGIVNATQGTVAGTTDPPFRRILAVLAVALVAVAALAMVALTLVAVALTYLGMNLADAGAAPEAPPVTSPSSPSPSVPMAPIPMVPSSSAPTLPPPTLPAPAALPPSPSAAPEAPSSAGALAPSVATPSSSGASGIRIVPMPLSMDAETATRLVREVRPSIEGCAVPSGYESTFIVARMAGGGATTARGANPYPDPNPAASVCIQDAFRIATMGLPGGLGVGQFHVVAP